MNTGRERAIQGNADGLCGPYAIMNFLVWKDEIPADKAAGTSAYQEAFRYVMEAAERAGLLSAHKLYSGFEWPDLIVVFNEYAERNYFDYVAVPLIKLHSRIAKLSNESLWGAIVDAEGAAVASVQKGGHWVLIYKRDGAGGFSVLDATAGNPKTELKKAWSLRDGMAMLPKDSDLLKDI
ncbi:MAG: hypothetical protein K2X59_12090 [Sphingomonas sp.]|nr:hypothetical protein [Sphingomonas sp.]